MNPLLLPVVAVQGIWARSRIERLSPAGGPTTGRSGTRAGTPLRLAVLGESTAAGCGADNHEEAFAGSFAAAIGERTGRPVEWEVAGVYGATALRIRHRVLPRLETTADIAVLLAGANDVLGRRPVADWAADLAAIVDGLRAERVVVVGVPPFTMFPSLPGVLARYLASRAAAVDSAAREVCAARSHATWLTSTDGAPLPAGFFARDGFHPSAIGYRHWANTIAAGLTL
ncbi:SGNH/GDSL hydrolase family protein [Phytomonospora endophytica]|uniref:Lysophospholipase L1-like esterase n=1 Tax=Phytomonospora endophytica TaxID=714109 RepID=A0A841FZI6_9ACTN|nr:SGNH/GDSL hydrolase family protein [Phytomonospora endophytica]MBB6037859.1 lysophospholipase L1-like esterase [Phytomonospora endophytica]GIG68758.1 hypothetical protein Pen01_50530 [Phytomonospora endophytica]